MANCPCPRCLIPIEQTHQLGTSRDQHWRKRFARVDNLSYRAKISSAREIIYSKNCAVNSKAVQDILKQQSLVPNEVFYDVFVHCIFYLLLFCRMHFHADSPTLDSICLIFF